MIETISYYSYILPFKMYVDTLEFDLVSSDDSIYLESLYHSVENLCISEYH